LRAIKGLQAEARFVVFKVCNTTTYDASVALIGRRNPAASTWTVEGWLDVAAGACVNAGKYARGTVYGAARVVGDSRGWRGTDLKGCVAVSGRFNHAVSDGGHCRPGEQTEEFSQFSMDEASYTWTIEEEPSEADNIFTFEVCNNSGIGLNAAVVGFEPPPSGQWVAKGWLSVAPGICAAFGKFMKPNAYAFAVAWNGETKWGGDHHFCVSSRRFNSAPSGECGDGERSEGFTKIEAAGERYTWPLVLQ